MASLAQIRKEADTKLVAFWDVLIAKQEQYFLKHDKFFQLLVTQPVVDGLDTTFEVIKPNDERHLVDVDFTFNSPIPFQIAVNEWVGETKGFTAVVVVELLDGRKFTRQRSATPVVQEAVYDTSDEFNPVLVAPKSITDWTIETTQWVEVIEKEL